MLVRHLALTAFDHTEESKMNSDTDHADDGPQFVALGRNDEDMDRAYGLASESIEDFKLHLRTPGDRLCSVKLRFRDPDESERLGEDRFAFIWLGSVRYHEDKDIFSAEFFELPEEFKKWHHVGERLGIEPEDIFDWMVIDSGRLYGGFTLRVARDRLPSYQRADYDSYIGVSMYEQATHPKQEAEQDVPSDGQKPSSHASSANPTAPADAH